MPSRTTRLRLNLRQATTALALVGVVAACGDNPDTTGPRQDARVRVEGDRVITPSGVVFTTAEWAAKADKSFWLVPAATTIARLEERQRGLRARAGQVLLSVTGHSAPSVLCHASSSFCSVIPSLVPGALITFWTDAQWGAATAAQFAEFDVIYIGDAAGFVDRAGGSFSHAGLVASRDQWGAATAGRIALAGVHFEHCFVDETHTEAGPCQVLKASVEWIHAGTGTGLLMSTQLYAGTMPTVAPYGGVTYLSHGGGYEFIRITKPDHVTMQGSTSASLSNFHQSSHSLFGEIGGFTNVAEVCGISYLEQADENCTGGTWHPAFLVSSLDDNTTTHVIDSEDGRDDVITVPDRHATLVVPDGALANNTVVTLERVVTPRVPLPVPPGQAYGPYYQIEVSPAQPLGPGVVWALCVDADLATAARLRIAKETHDPTDAGIIIFPRVDPGTLVDCSNEPSSGASLGPRRGGLGGSALRFASGVMSDALSVFRPTPAYAVHLGIGGRSDGSTTDTGYSLWGAVTTLYDVQGFFSPVANPGFTTPLSVNRVRAGRAVPVRFSLGGDFGLDVFAADSPTSAGYKCYQSDAEQVEETVTANASGLQYDAASGQYTYVWKTDAAWVGTCRELTITFKDGQTLSAFFEFTR